MSNQYKERSLVVKIIFIVMGVAFVVRLATLQLFDSKYKTLANQQALRNVTLYPARGLIFDRNGELLVHNEAVYDLMVIPKMMKENFDTAYFCKCLNMTRKEFDVKMKKAKSYSLYAPSVFIKQIPKDEYAYWQGKIYKFSGFYVQQRTLRVYDKPIAAHALGYVAPVDDADLAADSFYRGGDYIGKSGLEKSYEEILRGHKGKKVMHVDVHSSEIGSYQDGLFDTAAVEGGNLYTTLDAGLQEYAESLMANKRGCVVAIEPKTGEVLALVSAPFYDPNLLVGGAFGANYLMLQNDISKPLYNRAMQGKYPPGSIFKVAQAMTALQLGAITPNQGFVCDKILGCHNHPSARSVQEAIKMSCNPYFYYTYKRVIQQGKYENIYKDSQYGLMVWNEYMHRFGFGQKLGIDLPHVQSGSIPDTAYYNRLYGKERWAFRTIYSNSIGQGEVSVVPIQMANLACIVANRGYYYTPHLVRYYGADSSYNEEFRQKHETGINPAYFQIAVRGMYDVVHGAGGTAHRANIPDIDICGKTGTAENAGIDHSVFIAFAPMENPTIAVAVYIENAGAGGSWAAPIASLVIERYVRGEVTRKDFERLYRETNPCQKLPLPRRVKKKR